MTRLLLLALLLLVVAWAFWRLVDGVIETFGGTTSSRAQKKRRAAPVKLVRDPVCGTWVSPSNSRFVQVGDATHYFCSDDCRKKFQSR